MKTFRPPRPLELAKQFGIPRIEVAVRVGVTPDWLTKLARKPQHARRIRIAELEVILEQERLAQTLQSLLPGYECQEPQHAQE